jgi:hypothetical protein
MVRGSQIRFQFIKSTLSSHLARNVFLYVGRFYPSTKSHITHKAIESFNTFSPLPNRTPEQQRSILPNPVGCTLLCAMHRPRRLP